MGRYAAVDSLYGRLFADLLNDLGPDHPQTLSVENNYGWACQLADQPARAESLTTDALDRMRRVLGSDHYETLVAVNNLAIILNNQGKAADAEPLYLENVESSARVLGPTHPETVAGIVNLAMFYSKNGRSTDGLIAADRAIVIFKDLDQGDKVGLGFALNVRGRCLMNLGRAAEARRAFLDSWEIQSSILPPGHFRLKDVMESIAKACEASGRNDEAREWRERSASG